MTMEQTCHVDGKEKFYRFRYPVKLSMLSKVEIPFENKNIKYKDILP